MTIKISKLRGTGHIMRMTEENPLKKLTLLRSEGSRRAGRPKLRWLDGLERASGPFILEVGEVEN